MDMYTENNINVNTVSIACTWNLKKNTSLEVLFLFFQKKFNYSPLKDLVFLFRGFQTRLSIRVFLDNGAVEAQNISCH